MNMTTVPDFIKILPNEPLDDFFVVGFIAGIVGYAYYLYIERDDPKNHLGLFTGIYGVFLSGCVSGLLAVVFDKALEVSIIVGLFNQLIYMAIVRAAKTGQFWDAIKEVLLRYLTAGKLK